MQSSKKTPSPKKEKKPRSKKAESASTHSENSSDLNYRSAYLVNVFADFAITPAHSILEIGSGDGRNIRCLEQWGYKVDGIDKKDGTPIEDVEEKEYDVIYTMSTLFLIPPENDWVFEKIARMAKKYIVTIEGETTADNGVWGRNYAEVFKPYGFKQIYQENPVFNIYGVLRVLQKL